MRTVLSELEKYVFMTAQKIQFVVQGMTYVKNWTI